MTIKARATNQTKERRAQQVEALLIRGVPPAQILAFLRQSEGLSPRQAKRYLAQGKATIAVWEDPDSGAQLGLIGRRLEYLFQLALQNQDTAQSLKLLQVQLQMVQTQEKGKAHAPYSIPHPAPAAASAASPGCSAGLAEMLRVFETDASLKPAGNPE